MPPSEAQKVSLKRYRQSRTRLTVYLSDEAAKALDALAKVHGSKVKAVEAAVLAAKWALDHPPSLVVVGYGEADAKPSLVLADARSGRVEAAPIHVSPERLAEVQADKNAAISQILATVKLKPTDAPRKPKATKVAAGKPKGPSKRSVAAGEAGENLKRGLDALLSTPADRKMKTAPKRGGLK